MGSLGAVRNTPSNNDIEFNINSDRLDSYNFRDVQKEDMRKALDEAQEAITNIINDPWFTRDVDHLYEALADYFPRHIEGDEAEKVILTYNDYITTVDFRLWENGEGKIIATLEPHNYSIEEFSDSELQDMGIDKQYLSNRRK